MSKVNVNVCAKSAIVTDWSVFGGKITKPEATCQCGCGASYVSLAFAIKLLRARDIARIPFNFSSICRCPVHNEAEGGTEDSAHLSTSENPCEAADIKFRNNRELFKLVRALMQARFTRIGINYKKKFIHVDSDRKKDQFVLFSY